MSRDERILYLERRLAESAAREVESQRKVASHRVGTRWLESARDSAVRDRDELGEAAREVVERAGFARTGGVKTSDDWLLYAAIDALEQVLIEVYGPVAGPPPGRTQGDTGPTDEELHCGAV